MVPDGSAGISGRDRTWLSSVARRPQLVELVRVVRANQAHRIALLARQLSQALLVATADAVVVSDDRLEETQARRAGVRRRDLVAVKERVATAAASRRPS